MSETSLKKVVVGEVYKMLQMTVEKLREYEKCARSIPVGYGGNISPPKEIVQVNEDGIFYPTLEFIKLLSQQPESPFINLCIKPLKPENWYQVGLVFAGEKMFSEAINCFLRATELKPDFGDAWYNVGEVSFSKLGDAKNGRLGYTKAIECNAEDGDAVYNLGLIEFKELNLEAAETCFRKAITLRSDKGQTIYWLCMVLFFAGKKEELEKARQDLRQFLSFSREFETQLQNMLLGKLPDGN